MILTAIAFACVVVCCDDDSTPIEPYIEFIEARFNEGPGNSSPDTVLVTFSFRDGDDDLGISVDMVEKPYHFANYFLEDGHGNLTPVTTNYPYADLGEFIKLEPDQTGKLVTYHTRSKPAYSDLPNYVCPFLAINYHYRELYVSEEDAHILDDYHNVDTLENANKPKVYTVTDTLYYELNPNQFNVSVRIMVQQPDGSFSEFDIQKEFCLPLDFDGRFPDLSNMVLNRTLRSGPFRAYKHSKNRGVLTYRIASMGWNVILTGRKVKLEVSIKDRALHVSNTIETSVIQF